MYFYLSLNNKVIRNKSLGYLGGDSLGTIKVLIVWNNQIRIIEPLTPKGNATEGVMIFVIYAFHVVSNILAKLLILCRMILIFVFLVTLRMPTYLNLVVTLNHFVFRIIINSLICKINIPFQFQPIFSWVHNLFSLEYKKLDQMLYAAIIASQKKRTGIQQC